MSLEWRETAPDLLYEADGDRSRRYVVAYDGERWTLDLFLDSEYATEQQVDPQPAWPKLSGWRRTGKPNSTEAERNRSD